MRNFITSTGNNKSPDVEQDSENILPLHKPRKISRAIALSRWLWG